MGDLLSSNAVASVAAEGALLNLDDAHRAALAVNARRIPTERDPRWRNVLYQNGLLPNVTPDERLDLLVWAASRPSQVDVVKAQNELLDMAAKDPDLLLARLGRPGPGRDVIAVALSFAHERRAVPALVALYRGPSSPVERRAAAAALARLAGNDLAPRPDASDDERAKDAARLSAWYREKGGAADATR